jgi:hypothetical protein
MRLSSCNKESTHNSVVEKSGGEMCKSSAREFQVFTTDPFSLSYCSGLPEPDDNSISSRRASSCVSDLDWSLGATSTDTLVGGILSLGTRTSTFVPAQKNSQARCCSALS